MVGFLVFGIYLLGAFIYCLINHNRIDTVEGGWGDLGPYESTVESIDIVFESMLWPFYLSFILIISPVLILQKITEFIHKKSIESKETDENLTNVDLSVNQKDVCSNKQKPINNIKENYINKN